MTRAAYILVISLTITAMTSAAGQSRSVRAARLVSVAFEPTSITIDRPQVTQRLLVSGKYGDGSVRDVTSLAKFTSKDASVATVSKDGVVAPVNDGKVRIEGSVAGKRGLCEVVVKNSQREVAYRFATHIAPILTKAGCNGSNCHGSPVGKNGFKLSLFAYEPENDYRAIVKDANGRRVNLSDAANSLILRKPTLTEKHGGGKRFDVGSREYTTILNFLKSGAPAPRKEDTTIERVEVSPAGRVLVAKMQTQQVLVTAFYSDRTHEDVTDRTQFSSNDEGVATVTASGLVTCVGTGEAPIMVRYGGKVAVGLVSATLLQPLRTQHAAQAVLTKTRNTQQNLVDRFVFAKLQHLRIPTSDLCTDEEFLRRAYIDIIGTLPTAEEARAFLNPESRLPRHSRGTQNPVAKRGQLIDFLLARPEYADLQALLWADRLRSNSRFHRVGGVRAYQAWLKEAFAKNMPLDQFARALVTSKGKNYEAKDGAVNFWGSYDTILRPDEVAPQTSQLFMGVRIHCAQCHNHPFERWTQNDFYSMAAVFAQVQSKGTKNSQEFELFLDPKGIVKHPVTNTVMAPHAMDSPVFRASAASPDEVPDLRVKFADWLTAPDNLFFPKAMVNRLWRQFMGRGLVEPVDDFRVTNPPTHSELLDALARELVAHNFDQKRIIRLICNSRTYQMSATPPALRPLPLTGGERGVMFEADPANKYYARFTPKRMMAEVYLDAISQATGVPDEFKNYPEAKRAIQNPDNRFPSYFLDTFNRTNRLVICEREEEGTMSQALNLINGGDIHGKIVNKNGALAKLVQSGKADGEIMDELFLSALSRLPTTADRARLVKQMAGVPRHEAMQDLMWALLSSREFVFNH